LVPHISDPKNAKYNAKKFGCDLLVSPKTAAIKDVHRLIAVISSSDFVLAGAMHAAIVAHAYDVPFAFFQDGFVDCPAKWQDWLTAIGLSPEDAVFCSELDEGRAWYKSRRSRIRKRPLIPMLAAYRRVGGIRPELWQRALRHDLGTFS
jgi:hypothetical protein